MAEDKDPFAEFGGTTIKPNEDPFAEFGGAALKKKESSKDLKNGSEKSNSGLLVSQSFPLNGNNPEVPTVLIGDAKKKAQETIDRRKESLTNAVNAYKAANPKAKPNATKKNPDGGVAASFLSGLNKFNEGLFKTPKLIYDIASIPQNFIASITNTPELRADYDEVAGGSVNPLGAIDKLGDYYGDNAEAYQEKVKKYDKGVFDSLKDGDYKSAGEQVLNNLAQSAPSIAGMYVTGVVGNAAKLGNIAKTFVTALPFASSRNAELQERTDIPDYIKPINSVFNGLSEVVFDQSFGTKAILDNVITSFQRDGRDVAVSLTKDFVKGYAEKAIKKIQPLTSAIKNAIEEVSTQLSQNIVDKATINPDLDITQGLADAAIVGGVAGGGIQTVGNALSGIYNSKEKAVISKEVQKRNDLVTDLDNPDLPDNIKDRLADQLERSNDRIAKISDEAENKLNSLPEKEKGEAIELQQEIASIEDSLGNEGISESTKEVLINQLEKSQEKLDVLVEVSNVLNTPDTEESLTKEFQEAEKTFKKNGDQTAYDNEMASIEKRVQALKDKSQANEQAPEIDGVTEQVLPEQQQSEGAQPNIEEVNQIISTEEQVEQPVNNEQETTQTESSNNQGSDTVGGDIESETSTAEPTSEEVSINPTSIKNADVEARRDKYGLPELPSRQGITEEEATKLADKALSDGYDARTLVDAIVDDNRQVSAVENVILNKHQAYLDTEFNKTKESIEEYEGSSSGFEELMAKKDLIDAEYEKTMQASVKAGTLQSDALRSRQWFTQNDYSLSGMMEKMYKAPKNRKSLSSTEREDIREQFEAMQAKLQEYETKVKEHESKTIDTLADKAWKKLQRDIALEKRRQGREYRKEVIDKSIDDTLISLRKKIGKQRSTLSANPVPLEAFSDVAKLAKLYAKKGAISLEQAIDSVYNDLKDDFEGLNKDHIKQIIADIDKDDFRLSGYKTRTESNINTLRERINKGDFARRKIKPIELDNEAKELRDAYERLKYEFDTQVAKKRLEEQTALEKALVWGNEITGLFRVAKATLDLSAMLRQGGKAVWSHPVLFAKSVGNMFKAMWSDGKYERFVNDIKYAEDYQLMKESGLELTLEKSADILAREEATQGTLLEKLPIIGNAKLLDKIKLTKDGKIDILGQKIPLGLDLVGITERAYPAFLVSLRVNMFRQSHDLLQSDLTGEVLQKADKARARDINNLTGRANIGQNQAWQTIASMAFFSPRYIMSNVRTLTNWANIIWYKETPRAVQKMYAKEMASYVTGVSLIILAASLKGLSVSLDPYDPDFLKIKDKNTRLDISAGEVAYIRQFFSLCMIALGIRSKKGKNKLRTADDKVQASLQQLFRFGQGKLAPVPAIIINLTKGKNYINEEYGLSDIPKEFVPLVMGDLKDTFEANPNAKGIFYDALAISGVGVSTYKR